MTTAYLDSDTRYSVLGAVDRNQVEACMGYLSLISLSTSLHKLRSLCVDSNNVVWGAG